MRVRIVLRLIGALALVLVLAEGYCRLTPLGDPRLDILDHHAFRHQPGAVFDPLLGYRLEKNRPDMLLPQNARGFVGEDFAVPKPPGVFRIVCLGGSDTMGVGVDAARFAYPAQLGRMFALSAGQDARRVEVVNAGVYGYTSLHAALRATGELDALEPDLVVLMEGLNDLDAAQALAGSKLARLRPAVPLARQEGSAAARFFEPLARTLAFSSLPARIGEFVHARSGSPETGQGLDTLPEKVRLFGHEANLARILAHARGRGVQAVLVDEPMRLVLPPSSGGPVPSINPDLAQVIASGAGVIGEDNLALSRRYGAPLVQANALFLTFLGTPDEARVWEDDLHLARYGYYLLAREVYRTLMALPAVQQAVGRQAPLPDATLDKAFESLWTQKGRDVSACTSCRNFPVDGKGDSQ